MQGLIGIGAGLTFKIRLGGYIILLYYNYHSDTVWNGLFRKNVVLSHSMSLCVCVRACVCENCSTNLLMVCRWFGRVFWLLPRAEHWRGERTLKLHPKP